MALVIDRNNQNKFIDRTDLLVQAPKKVSITDALNLFTEVFSTQKRIEIVRTSTKNHVLTDRNWKERGEAVGRGERSAMQLLIPRFSGVDAIYPDDVDGVVAVNSIQEAMGLESVANVRAEKMMALMDAHTLTKEVARMQLITEGTVYAPNGTLATSYGPTVNFYTEMGVTRVEEAVTLLLATDPRKDIDTVRRAVLEGARGAGLVTGVVAMCSRTWFDALQYNAYVQDAMKASINTQAQSLAVLLGRPDNNPFGLDARFRSITVFGVTFIDASEVGFDDAEGNFVPSIPEGEAYFMPAGVRNMFKTYYAPAEKFSFINRQARGSYWFEYANDKDDIIEIQTEQNMLNAMLYPRAVVKATIA